MHFSRILMPAVALAFAAGVAGSPGASAHSTQPLEATLGAKEKYFQPIDRDAPAFALRDAAGEVVRLADLRGRVVVLNFVYASCPDVCPLHAEKLARVQEMVNQTPMKGQVRFVSITTDPEDDTAEVLREYGPAHGLDPVNWTFLTTAEDQPEDATRRLAKAFGHTFSKTGDGNQVHGVVTHVIDQQGRWRANFHGLRFEPTNLVMFINALVNEAGAAHDHGADSLWERVKEMF